MRLGAVRALHDPRADQDGRRIRKSSRQRGQREAGDPDQEHTPAAVAVPESTADNQQHAHREGVTRAEPLDQRLAAGDVAHTIVGAAMFVIEESIRSRTSAIRTTASTAHGMTAEATIGQRKRKKAQTRRSISDATLKLFIDAASWDEPE